MRRWLADPAAGPALGGLIGLGAFASSLGLAIVDPRFIDWVMYGDLRIHFLGWHTYRGAPWQWPLGANPFFGTPVGTSVALTDSLPLFAVMFKALDPILPIRFQYIGLWLLLCFVLQGVFGALLMRVVTARVSLQALGSAMFVLAPVLLHRAGHPALTAHWLLLAALWQHARMDDGDSAVSSRAWAGWAALVAITAATHAYLTFMVMAIAASQFAGVVLVTGRRVWRAVAALVSLVLVAALTSWQAGYFVVGSASDLDTGDFGIYSMNLLGPVAPVENLALLGPLVLPDIAQTTESFAYLGAGTILLAIAALCLSLRLTSRGSWRSTRRHWPLVAVLGLLLIMALGPDIRLGAVTLVSYDEGWWEPLAVFRANGRMVWPALYAGTFVVLAAIGRNADRRTVALVLSCVMIQAVDVSRAYVVAQQVRDTRWTPPLPSRFWTIAAPTYRHLVSVPSNMCAAERFVDFEPLALLAGDFDLSVNAGLAARFDTAEVREYCQQLTRQMSDGEFDAETLYVFQRDLAPVLMARARRPIVCVTVDGYVACAARDTYARWQDGFDATSGVLPPLAEFLNGYADLDDEYGRMQRTPVAQAGTREERVGAIRMYLIYRLTGCDHGQALDKIVRTLAGEPEPRACGNPMGPRSPLPRPDEIFAFRRDLDRQFRRLGRPEQATRIDLEGEAVWLLEYARARLADQSDEAAQDTVREMVRRITGR